MRSISGSAILLSAFVGVISSRPRLADAMARDVQAAFDLGTNLIDLRSLPEADVPHLVAKKVESTDVFLVAST